MKRFGLFFLTLALVCGAFVGWTTSAEQAGDLTYTVADGKATVTRYTGNGGKVEIPAKLGGADVIAIGEYAFSGRPVTTVTLPNSLQTIGKSAFSDCTKLETVDFGTGVTTIGAQAFTGCTALTALHLPASVSRIDVNAFTSTSSLATIEVDGANATYYAASNCLIEKESGTLLQGCSNSVIPATGVTSIGRSAFASCTELETIAVPDSVGSVGEYAFSGCTALQSVKLGKNVGFLDDSAFSGCVKLAEIDLPAGLTVIGDWAFFQCASLLSIALPDGLSRIGEVAFGACVRLRRIEIPASVTSVGEDVFSSNDGMRHVYCLAAEKPIGWNSKWLGCNAQVHWGTEMPECEHDERSTHREEPTCTEAGYVDEVCDICGEVLSHEELPAGHKYENGKCTVCGERDPDAPALATGDLDGNGNIDGTDYLLMKRYILGTYRLTEEQNLAADVNHDGAVDSGDYLLIKRHVLGTYKIH